MALTYGFLKCKVISDPALKATKRNSEIQYHLHTTLRIANHDGSGEDWDSAINVGTNDSDDLLKYQLVFDFQHPLTGALSAAPSGFSDLTGALRLSALDFLRSDVLKQTGSWRPSDVMDGSDQAEPIASLLRLLRKARSNQLDVYVFGRKYSDGLGIHDVHMNQGSQGQFLNNGRDDHNDHNDIWQDGAVLVDLGGSQWAGYFTAFTQQLAPTDRLGNPVSGSHPISISDDGSLAA